jgi:hypothetical protein
MVALDPPAAIQRHFLSVPPLRILAVLGGFILLTAIFFWPVLAQLSSVLIGPPEDNMQDFWNSWHTAMAGGWGDFIFTTQIHFPEGTPLTYHSFAYPQVFAVALLAKLFGTEFATLVTLQNLTLLASFPLAAVGAFFLARHLLDEAEGRDGAAVVAGFIFAFNPWHVAQVMHHAHVATIQFLPLFVLFYLLALERRSFRWLAGAAAMQALSALSCWYFLFYTIYFMAFHLVYLRMRNGRWPWGWNFAAPALCTAGAAVPLSPWLIPMAASGLNHTLYYVGNNMFVADLFAYVAFPPTHLLARFGSGVYARITGNAWEGTVYLGLANLIVLIGALWMARKAPDDKRLLFYGLGGMIFFAAIASGEALHVNGHVVTMLHMPGAALDKLPFFANVRTPARAMVFVYLFLGLALAQATVMAWRHRGHVAHGAVALAAVLMLLDFTPVKIAVTPATCPAALATIARDPNQGFGVLDLPGGYGNGNAYMMLSACHGHAIVQGETSRQMSVTLKDRLKTDNLAAQKRQLAAARVKYIVLHKPKGDMFRWNRADGAWQDYPKIYRSRSDGPDMTVFQVY